MFIDIAIVLIALWALFKGWQNGLIKELVSTVGFIAGLIVASLFYSFLGEYLGMDGTATYITNIVAFIILWIITPIVLGFVANTLTAALRGLQLGWPNSLLGAAVSFTKYLILLSCVFNVMSILGIVNQSKADASRLYVPVRNALSVMFSSMQQAANAYYEEATKDDTLWVHFNQTSQKDSADAVGTPDANAE